MNDRFLFPLIFADDKRPTYDPASYELAEHFLKDEPCHDDPELFKKHCHSLALEIQRTVEDWCYTSD